MPDVLYEDLAPGNIRLLRFLDKSGQRCTLSKHHLHEAPSYCTLSYTWNSDECSDGQSDGAQANNVIVDGFEIVIQSNLFTAFKHIAPTAYESKKYVWADYICINQSDDVEKSSQVRMMKEIYFKAEFVCAWLGMPRDEHKVRLAVELVTSLGNSWRRGTVVSPGDIESEMRETRQGFPASDPDSVAAWLGLQEIFRKPFWRRTWCHLECSKADVRFHCGNHTFDSFDFYIIGTAIHVYRQLPGWEARPHFVYANRLFNARVLKDLSQRENIKTRSLLYLLSDLRPTLCADARDKVFAAIPHADDVADKALWLDYSKSLSQVYIDVVEMSMRSGSSGLKVLGYACSMANNVAYGSSTDKQRLEPALPSWVPDWRIATDAVGLTDGTHEVSWNPCPGTSSTASIQGSEFHVQGFIVDTVAVVTDPVRNRGDMYAETANWKQHLSSHGVDVSQATFHRTITGNGLLHVVENGKVVHKRCDEIDWDRIHEPQTGAEAQSRGHIHSELLHFCGPRKMGFTKSGLQLGLLPSAARVDDNVVAFEGGKTLYVVRKLQEDDDKFGFVGECYVDGLMDGQLKERDLLREHFVLV